MTDALSLPTPHADLAHQSSHRRAALYIRRLILDGVVRPGSRVPQDEVAAALGLSRNPVREALIALDGEGWVTIEPNRGAFVNVIDAASIMDHYELCAFIHALALRRAMTKGDADLLDRLETLVAELMSTNDTREADRLAVCFHRAVITAADSPRINAAHRANSSLLPGNFFEYVPGSLAVERDGLRAIVQAARTGAAGDVEVAYRGMMRQFADLVVHLFRERGLFAPDNRLHASAP